MLNKPELDYSVEANPEIAVIRDRYFKAIVRTEDSNNGFVWGALLCKYQIMYNGLKMFHYSEIDKYAMQCFNELLRVNVHFTEFSTDEFKSHFMIGFKEYFTDYCN